MVFIRSLSRQLRRPASQLLSGASKPTLATNFFARPTGAFANARTLTASASLQGKVLLVLYDVSSSLNSFSPDIHPSLDS